MGRHQSNMVILSEEERNLLEENCRKGTWTPRQIIRAKILLLANQNGSQPHLDHEIAEKLNCSLSAVRYRRKRFINTKAIEDTIFDDERSGRPSIIDGAIDAHMTTIACCEPPLGHSKWSLRLIKDRLIALEIIDDISHTTVSRTLKKKKLSLG